MMRDGSFYDPGFDSGWRHRFEYFVERAESRTHEPSPELMKEPGFDPVWRRWVDNL